MSSWSLFYKELDDLISQVQFKDQENGDLLYYTFSQYLKDQILSDWTYVVHDRDTDEDWDVDHSPDNFVIDIQPWKSKHESLDPEELLQDQKAYITHLVKPKTMSPTNFKTMLVHLNNHLALIPKATEEDQYGKMELKSMYLHTMPKQWCQWFKEVSKKIATETIDGMAQFFMSIFMMNPRAISRTPLLSHQKTKPVTQMTTRESQQVPSNTPSQMMSTWCMVSTYGLTLSWTHSLRTTRPT